MSRIGQMMPIPRISSTYCHTSKNHGRTGIPAGELDCHCQESRQQPYASLVLVCHMCLPPDSLFSSLLPVLNAFTTSVKITQCITQCVQFPAIFKFPLVFHKISVPISEYSMTKLTIKMKCVHLCTVLTSSGWTSCNFTPIKLARLILPLLL